MRKLKPANQNEPAGLEIGVVPLRNDPDRWLVEAIDHGSDGEIYRAIFSGPNAKERAFAYARLTYGWAAPSTQISTST